MGDPGDGVADFFWVERFDEIVPSDIITGLSQANGDKLAWNPAQFNLGDTVDFGEVAIDTFLGTFPQFLFNTGTGALVYDDDGLGPAPAELLASLIGVTTLSHGDFRAFTDAQFFA